MLQLADFGFLPALGKAIAASIWQMGLLFIIYQIIIALFKIKQASAKNLLSTIFSLGGFLWFALSFLQFIVNTPKSSLVIEKGAFNNKLLQEFAAGNQWQLLLNQVEYRFNLLLPYLSIAYLFVLLWFALKLSIQLYQTHQLKSKGVNNVHEELEQLIKNLSAYLGIAKKVTAFISLQIDIPATVGFIKPVILLPAAAVTHLSPAQIEAVLLHELAHIRRHDYLINLLLSIAETFLFFNPFALLLINTARKERENSCDDVVMQYQQNAADYAEALLNVEKARLLTPQLAMALGDNKHHLLQRVKRILNVPVEKNKISTRLLALLFFTFVFALTGWVLQTKKQPSVTNEKTAQPQTRKGETLVLSPDVVIKNENKSITLRDGSKKINLEIKRENSEDKFILLNEDGKRFEFDKLVFEELPAEWMYEFIPDDAPLIAKHPRQLQMQGFPAYEMHDTLMREQYRNHYNAAIEQYRRNNSRMKIVNGKREKDAQMHFYFKDGDHFDSVMQGFNNLQPFYNFEMKEMPFVLFQKNEALTDKMKKMRSKTLQVAELKRRSRILEKRTKELTDSTEEQFYVLKQRQLPQEWSAFIEKPMEAIIKEQRGNVTIVIENNRITVNGRTIQIDSSQNNQQQLRGKMIRIAEVMKL